MESASNKRILQNLFRYYFTRHPEIKLPLKDIKAVEAIMQCQTTERGFNILSCPQGHSEKVQTHACRHRSCPICADRARFKWIESEKQRLLDCAHYHVIFTLPHEYLNLWQYNRKWFTRHLFKACRDTLLELLQDPRYLGATPGILMALHSWGRQLNYHPHIHCLVSAGGLSDKNEWKPVEDDFLLPIRVVKALYRGKFQAWIKEALLNGDLTIPDGHSLSGCLSMHAGLYRQSWSVRIQERYEHGRGVALYLARYIKGGPIKPAQIHCTGDRIRFQYHDHREKRKKICELSLEHFIQRILWHVPENGIHTVRHYGLYASRNKTRRQGYQLKQGPVKSAEKMIGSNLKDAVNWCCETCGAQLQRTFSTYQRRGYENSIIKSLRTDTVQQEVKVERERQEKHQRWRNNYPNQYFFRPLAST